MKSRFTQEHIDAWRRDGAVLIPNFFCATRCWRNVTNLLYRGFDLDYPDVERAKVFLADLASIRESRRDAATDGDAHGQRSYQRHRGRQALAALARRR